MSLPKPVPTPVGLNAEFYEHCREGRLSFQQCGSCEIFRHPPRVLCPSCGSATWAWVASSGHGRLHTWTVIHQHPHPGFADDLPLAVVVVELDEGVRLVSGIRGLAPSDLVEGMPLVVGYEQRSPEITLPVFHRAQD